MSDLKDLVQQLSSIEEQLAELAIDRLQVSIADDNPAAAGEERVITRARRAIEKAVVLLDGMPTN